MNYVIIFSYTRPQKTEFPAASNCKDICDPLRGDCEVIRG